MTFDWADNGNVSTEWRLAIGGSVGAAAVYDSGVLAAIERSHQASGLPTDGRQLFVRLWYRVSGVLSYADFLYTAALQEPDLTSPVPGSVLSGTEITFVWGANGAAVTQWRLLVGSTVGASNYGDSGPLAATTLARTVTGLPTDGVNVHVRLEYVIGGASDFKDFVYISGVGMPEILAPTPESVLTGPDVTFSWTANDAPVVWWLFYVGTSPGSSDLYYSGYLAPGVTSASVTGLPTDSRTIHVRLRYLLNGLWQSIDYQYTAADITPELLAPTPGSVFTGSDVDFTWTSNGSAVTYWILYVGTSPGSTDLHYSGTLASTVTSRSVTGLPTDSRTIHVRLRYLLNGAWQYTDYPFTAADLVPDLVVPTPGTVLPGADVTFAWTSNGSPVQTWVLEVGSSPGLSNYFYSGSLASDVVSATATGIPTDSRPIHVRLRYLLSGAWSSLDFDYIAADLVPELVSPVPGSVLPSENVTFTWTSSGSLVSNWTLGIGTQLGLSNIYYSGTLASSVLSVGVTGLPVDNSTLHVRLRYLSSGAWSTLDYVVTASAPPPVMTSPAPGSQLADTTVTFDWADNGNVSTEWRLAIGGSVGAADVYDSGVLAAIERSHQASGLPTDGRQLFVRLWYRVSGVLSYADFLYTAALQEPDLTSPVPGSMLSGPETTFVWGANGAAVTQWRLLVGSTVGASNYGDSGPLAATTLARTVTGLPTDGVNVHVRLEYVIGGASDFKDFVYISGVGMPEILAPTPESVLTGPDVTFSWTANDAPVVWWLFYVGTSPGSSDLYYSGYLAPGVTSASVTGLPTDSRTIHVRLRYLLNGLWQSIDYQYTAADITPELLAPTPGSVFTGSDVDFTWTSNGSAVTYWILYVGTSPGSTDLHYSGTLASTVTSRSVTGLPTDSRTIHVRLRYLLNGAWQYTDYQFTAADLVPDLVVPTPGTVLPGADVTFAWTSNGAPVTWWVLDVGTTPGSSDLHYSGTLPSSVLSTTATGLPTDGSTIYVRLRYVLSGAWKSQMFEYTATTSP